MSFEIYEFTKKNGQTVKGIELHGVQLAWPFLGSKTSKFANGKKTVDVSRLTKEQVKALKSLGFNVRQEDAAKLQQMEDDGKTVYDRETFLTAKSSQMYYRVWNGHDLVFDPRNESVQDVDFLDRIGNGTVVNIRIDAVPYTMNGGGVMAGLSDIVIVKLESYGGDKSENTMFTGVETNPLPDDDGELNDELPEYLRA